jgi:hypothetical protein
MVVIDAEDRKVESTIGISIEVEAEGFVTGSERPHRSSCEAQRPDSEAWILRGRFILLM